MKPLSPHDPHYYEKYIAQHPQDGEMRYHYGRYLEYAGRIAEAISQYEQAAKLGELSAVIRLKQVALQRDPRSEADKQQTQPAHRKRRAAILLFLLLLLSLPLGDIVRDWSAAPARDHPTTASELPEVVLENAIIRYQQAQGAQPAPLTALTQPAPNNWLSALPGPRSTKCPCGVEYSGLKLIFYPQTNQLGLARGSELLALYPVASGPPMPFTHSQVSKRVVNPNGGHVAYGTRGLELQDNFAIHGTNVPDSIGKKGITKGCLRLQNADIEVLYSYVSIGTPFEVQPTTIPPKPTFPAGLPRLKTGPLTAEETPGIRYAWKN